MRPYVPASAVLQEEESFTRVLFSDATEWQGSNQADGEMWSWALGGRVTRVVKYQEVRVWYSIPYSLTRTQEAKTLSSMAMTLTVRSQVVGVPDRMIGRERDNYVNLVDGDWGFFWFCVDEIIKDKGMRLMAIPIDYENLAYVVDISHHMPRFHDPVTFAMELGDWEKEFRWHAADLLTQVLSTTPLLLRPAPMRTTLATLARQDVHYHDPSEQGPTKFRRMESTSGLIPWSAPSGPASLASSSSSSLSSALPLPVSLSASTASALGQPRPTL
jgi:hypothetical protein